MRTEVEERADFSIIRYAQVWEDADILLAGLEVGPEDECLSIASAGDNALALLARGPRRVVAVDLNPAQLRCVEIRVAAFRRLEHPEILELIGSKPSRRRLEHYKRLRGALSEESRTFWDQRPGAIEGGIGSAGKFERYFRIFRKVMLPLVHTRARIDDLLLRKTVDERRDFHRRVWNNRRWRILFQIFFSRTTMGALGRDPSFFRYVDGSVANRILGRTRHALTELDPHENPYLQWILTGRHRTATPFYLREENFEAIRANLDRLEIKQQSVEEFLATCDSGRMSKFNLSDIFEYMSDDNTQRILETIAASAREGGRLAYWNMLVPRQAGEKLGARLQMLTELSKTLHFQDKAFFYSRFIVEEVR